MARALSASNDRVGPLRRLHDLDVRAVRDPQFAVMRNEGKRHTGAAGGKRLTRR